MRSQYYMAMMQILMSQDMYGHDIPSARKQANWMEHVDIAKEYKLIQAKKSKLSATKRRVVVAYYERTLTKEMG